MEAIKTLREIICVLTTEEKASIRSYLRTFVLEWKGETNKGLQLFDYLTSLENRKVSTDQIELAIYKKPNTPALKKLANRTRHKVQEALIIDVNIDREGMYPERVKAIVDVRKKLIQGLILHRRGLVKLAKRMFDGIVEQCIKYEFYEEHLFALRTLIRSRSLEEGDKHLPHLMKKYLECDHTKNAVLRAEIYFTQITAPKDFHSELKIDNTRLREMLDQMRDDFSANGSATIGHYYLQLEAQNYQDGGDYKKARTELLNDLKLIQNSPSIKTPDNLIGVLLNLADNDLYLGQFERARLKANEAMQLCRIASHNYEICAELMFYSRFYNREYKLAQDMLQEFIPSEDESLNFRAGKRSYFLAATNFMLKDYNATAKSLNVVNPIDSDKDGWFLAIKILQIMSAIELNEFDEATAKTEALRKYFANGNGANNKRAKLIHSILNNLSNNGYNFKSIYQEQKSFFDMMSDGGELEWKVKSSELVVFHQWFFAKAARQELVLEIPPHQPQAKTKIADKSNADD